jgi:hypothetical protein
LFCGGRNPGGQIEKHYFGRAFKEHYPQLETLRLVELKPRVATKTILCAAFIFKFESKSAIIDVKNNCTVAITLLNFFLIYHSSIGWTHCSSADLR